MRFYRNDAEAAAASHNRISHRALLAEWRDGGGNAAPLACNSVHPEFREHVPGLVARAGLTALNMREQALDAISQLRGMAGHHAVNAGMSHIPSADREAWAQSAEALKALADRARDRLDGRAAA